MIRYYLREENDVLILANNEHQDVCFYHAQYGRRELEMKTTKLKERGIDVVRA